MRTNPSRYKQMFDRKKHSPCRTIVIICGNGAKQLIVADLTSPGWCCRCHFGKRSGCFSPCRGGAASPRLKKCYSWFTVSVTVPVTTACNMCLLQVTSNSPLRTDQLQFTSTRDQLRCPSTATVHNQNRYPP